MSRRLSESERRHKYSYYATHSPLKTLKVTLPTSIKELNQEAMKKRISQYEEMKKERERNFVLDGVHEHVHKSNVVPSYNAFLDPHAQSYFRQPAIQVMMKKAAEKGELIPPAIATHKLSTRRRIPNTPGKQDIVQRENRYIIDSVRADSLKNRRNPVIPQYDALNDLHAQNYFKKKSVRHLLQRTCNIKI